MSNIQQTLEGTISMPKTIIIGDPLYFENYPERTDLVYSRNFRGKKEWLGYISLKEIEEEYEIDNKTYKYTTFRFNAIFAPDKEKLELYKRGNCFKTQTYKITEIGVDTAEYLIQINNVSDTIKTQGDGYWGNVVEFYKYSKLEGISIDMTLPDYFSFEEAKKEIEYLFDFKF